MSSCNCIAEKPKQIVEGLNATKEYNGSVKSARLKDAQLVITQNMGLTSKLSTPLEIEITGRKTPKKMPLFFNYCPFCGQEYKTA